MSQPQSSEHWTMDSAERDDASRAVEAPDAARPMYSVVIPVYYSAAILPELVRQLESFFEPSGLRYELIFVNDGSRDDSWRVLLGLKESRRNMVVIDLMRNYGQHSAVFCGLQHARGDFVITMDDDLQNPPRELRHLIDKIDEGYDVVFGKFQQKIHGFVRRIGSHIVGWLNRKLFNKPNDLVLTNFRIIRREVVNAVCETETTYPYIPGLLLLSSNKFANVTVEHHPRAEGQSHYTWRVIATLIWRIIFNYSSFPMRFLCGIGGVTALISFLLGIGFLIRSMFVHPTTQGWLSVVVLLSFYQGLILLLFATIGEYIVRIANDVSRRRPYQIRTKR